MRAQDLDLSVRVLGKDATTLRVVWPLCSQAVVDKTNTSDVVDLGFTRIECDARIDGVGYTYAIGKQPFKEGSGAEPLAWYPTLEIQAEIPSGASENVVRAVTENTRTLKFTSAGFEKEQRPIVRAQGFSSGQRERAKTDQRDDRHERRLEQTVRYEAADAPSETSSGRRRA